MTVFVCLPSQIDLMVDSGLVSVTFLPTGKRIIVNQSLIKVWAHNCSGQEKHWVFFNLMKISGVTELRAWRCALRVESEHTHCREPTKRLWGICSELDMPPFWAFRPHSYPAVVSSGKKCQSCWETVEPCIQLCTLFTWIKALRGVLPFGRCVYWSEKHLKTI